MIETACDLLKYVVRYFRTSIYFDVSNGLWHELTDPNVWLGLAFAIVLVVLSTWVLDAWKWADPRRSVRTALVVVSVIVTGFVDPFGYIFRKDLLQAFEKAQKGETMDVVMHGFDYGSPIVEPHTEKGSPLSCVGECWIRVSYDLPVVLGELWIRLEFDREQHLISKSDCSCALVMIDRRCIFLRPKVEMSTFDPCRSSFINGPPGKRDRCGLKAR